MRAKLRVPRPAAIPPRPAPEDDLQTRQAKARALTCGQVMSTARQLHHMESVHTVLQTLTRSGWDHIFLVDDDGLPIGRVHAVDLLRLVARKEVNRDVAWMHAESARRLVSAPPLSVRTSTPLLAAAALLVTHDLTQIAVTDGEGALCGVITLGTVARHLPKFVL